MSWPQVKKIVILKCRLLRNNGKPSACDVQWNVYFIWPLAKTLSDWTEKQLHSTSQGQTCTKKNHGHCLVVCCWSEPLQLSESQKNCYIWEVCSVNRWGAQKTAVSAAGTGQQSGPNSPWQCPTACCTTNASKVENLKNSPYYSQENTFIDKDKLSEN